MTVRRLCLLSAITLIASSCSPGEGKVAYVGANLWDGTGARAISNAVVLVAGTRIEAIGSADLVMVPRGAEIVDVNGKWIVPGLIDGNAHTKRWMLPHFLRHGVTAIRDAGGQRDSILALRNDVATGAVLGPRIYSAGAPIDVAPAASPIAEGVRTPVDARRAVGNRRLNGATHVMLSPRIRDDLFRAIMDEADALNLPVAAHLGRVDAVSAASGGLHSIEHLSGIVEATSSNRASLLAAHQDFTGGWIAFLAGWASLDSSRLENTVRRLRQTNVALVPTLVHQRAYHTLDQQESDVVGLTPAAAADLALPAYVTRTAFNPAVVRRLASGFPMQQLFVRRFHASGGLVVAGSGAPSPYLVPGQSLHEELAMLVSSGLTPTEALTAATLSAARLLGSDSIGVLQSGTVADFLILNANPLSDIANIANIDRVVFRGTAYAPNDLRQ